MHFSHIAPRILNRACVNAVGDALVKMDRIRPAAGNRAGTMRANNDGFQMYAELPSRRAREKKQRNEKHLQVDDLMFSAEQDKCYGRIPDR
jgi:hypothetical protein